METINFETAKLAKEKGFYEFGFRPAYDLNGDLINSIKKHAKYPRPYQAELQEWLREEFDIHIVPIIDSHSQLGLYGYKIYGYNTNEFLCLKTEPLHLSYEGAIELGLLNGLNLI